MPSSASRSSPLTLADGLLHALAEIARLVAVAQFDRFAGTGRCARRHGRPRRAAIGQRDIGFDGRVAA